MDCPDIGLLHTSLQVIKGFDQAVTGLAVGESRKERIDPENAVSIYLQQHAQGRL